MINHVKQWHSTTHQPQMSPLSLVCQCQIQPLDHFDLSLPSHPLALRDFRASKHQLYPLQSLPWRYRMQRGDETSAGFFSRIGRKYKNLVKNAWAWDIIALHWQSEESVKGYWLVDSQLWILKWSESEEWSMLLLPSFTWGFLSSYVLVALCFLRFFSRLAFSDDTTTLNNGLPNQQNGQQNAAPDAVERPINLNLPATCSAVCFFRILPWLWNCPFLSADVTSEGRCYMSSQRRPLFAPSLFFHLQPSRNRQCHWDPFPVSASAIFMTRSTSTPSGAWQQNTSKHQNTIKERMWKNGIERHHSITPNPKGSFKCKKEIRNHPIARQTQGLIIKNSVELQPIDQ